MVLGVVERVDQVAPILLDQQLRVVRHDASLRVLAYWTDVPWKNR